VKWPVGVFTVTNPAWTFDTTPDTLI